MARVVWLPTARFEFGRIIESLAKRSPQFAEKWGGRVEAAVGDLVAFPEIGNPIEDVDFLQLRLRERIVKPYRIIYRYTGTECRIMRIVHTSQDLSTELGIEDLF